MAADIKLDGNQVKVEAPDLCLDGGEGRNKTGGQRRALVHDYDDGLTLNWGNDYPGGINFVGTSEFHGPAKFKTKWQAYDLEGGLAGVFWVPWPEGAEVEIDLQDFAALALSRIMELGREVIALKQRVAELEQ